MRVPKVYFDVDALSYAAALPKDETWKTDIIRKVVKLAEKGKVRIIVSVAALETSIAESGIPPEKAADYIGRFRNYLSTIPHRTAEVDIGEVMKLARAYVFEGAVKKYENALHAAMACLAGADYFLSWDEEHLLKRKVMEKVTKVNERFGLKTPKMMKPEKFKL